MAPLSQTRGAETGSLATDPSPRRPSRWYDGGLPGSASDVSATWEMTRGPRSSLNCTSSRVKTRDDVLEVGADARES